MDDPRFQQAVELFEEAHREDARSVQVEGQDVPWSLHYHRRMRHWLDEMDPHASLPLQLAVHCQHIRRWRIPRDQFPKGTHGYRQWRSELARFHGDEAAAILHTCGFDATISQRVKDLLQKKRLQSDPETQTLEDVACLVFIENELATFARKHEEEKLLSILRKTWDKMSERGRNYAIRLAASLPSDTRQLIQKATSTGA